ncbi:unnamed protein product [Amoebophrya sp. A25]|nr:unnamed protein product [Amoebophrya sp. A25]|eukprot:GSA25T00005220001.1
MTAGEIAQTEWRQWYPPVMVPWNRFVKSAGDGFSVDMDRASPPTQPCVPVSGNAHDVTQPTANKMGNREAEARSSPTTTSRASFVSSTPAPTASGGTAGRLPPGAQSPVSDDEADRSYNTLSENFFFSPRFQNLGRETAGALPTRLDGNLGWVLGHTVGERFNRLHRILRRS